MKEVNLKHISMKQKIHTEYAQHCLPNCFIIYLLKTHYTKPLWSALHFICVIACGLHLLSNQPAGSL